MSTAGERDRVLSGMRPTGRLHIGHYHGALKNWARLQNEYDSFFFVADWHALTTHYEDPAIMEGNIWEMVVDWLAAGIDPERATLFIQSRLPQHAELHLLLSMVTPLGWLERVPSFKDQQQRLRDRNLATYGFLGYPLLQSADILMYRASWVPVGQDQVPHVELTREIARRFNHIFGKDAEFEEKAEQAVAKLGKKAARSFSASRQSWLRDGNEAERQNARELLEAGQNLSAEEKERLRGYLDGSGRTILTEPKALLTRAAKLPGLDGQKMSKSYNNAISLREPLEDVRKKISTMPTDPARVRLSDPGNPEKCPVWQLHENYSDPETKAWVVEGCKNASIGCLDCKKPVIDAIVGELEPIQKEAQQYEQDPDLVRSIIIEGCDTARESARETLSEVRTAMGLTTW